jgi:hypothetical protein
MTKEIGLTRGYKTIVSIEDYEWLMQWKWFANKQGPNLFYVARMSYGRENGIKTQKMILMHKEIVEKRMNIIIPNGMEIDHADTNSFNNSRDNLRLCPHSFNTKNRSKSQNCSSQYKGVSLDKRNGTWLAYIKVNYNQISLGRFNTEEEAALVYNEAALKYFGEFAKLNKIGE